MIMQLPGIWTGTEPLLKDRVVLVTGASRGIGAATATLLARHGAAVGVNYLQNTAAAEQVVATITAAGGRAQAFQGDMADPQQIEQVVTQMTAAFGPIDTLVANAYAMRTFTAAPFLHLAWDQYEEVVMGETKALFLPAKAVVPGMIAQGRGCIIGVSSLASRQPLPAMAPNSSGKAALDALVRGLATELGPHGIRVNVVAPGVVNTDASRAVFGPLDQSADPGDRSPMWSMFIQMTPLQRVAEAEDIAGAILMMASDAASFVTGAYVPVCGGSYMP